MHLLVVDDETDIEPLFRQKFRKELKSQTVALHFAFSAPAALAYLNEPEQRTQITLVLSDINMPEMTGLEMLTVINGQYPELPVMIMSAYSDADTQHQVHQQGAIGFIRKPVDFKDLKRELLRLSP
ncbi:MAG: response regulator [Spirulina sp. SIO3F2]|nr:response regulator [Spirulina sp. SIO3F2]